MTRIIAGFAGSHRLRVPASGTRPTSDRVREAIFSALASRDSLAGATVLDLYAGSGALGLEAASRGARHVVLVEKNRAAARIAKANADLVTRAAEHSIMEDARPRVVVAPQAAQSYLDAGAAAMHQTFDLVFIDPPYEVDNQALLKNLEALVPLLAPAATVVIERSTRSGVPQYPASLELVRQKAYGDTTLFWLEPRDED